jgi:hypothetical protein
MSTYEIPVSRKQAPPVFALGDLKKAVTDARHMMHPRYGAVMDAVLRALSQLTPEQIQAARIKED